MQTCWNVRPTGYIKQLKLMTVPSIFHMSVVIINWHTAGEIEDWIFFT